MDEEAIFLEALQRTPLAARIAFLDDACAGNPSLREEVEMLLKAHEKAGGFLQGKPPGLCPTIDQPPLERPGTRIGPYKLLEKIGEGGMGVVYMAEQEEPVARRVALKIIKPGMDTQQVVARFEAERQALAMMDHPNIAKVFDVGTTDSGRPYFVMELIHGIPVTQFCDQQHLTARERLELFIPICQAVQHAHQKGIIHRDIKPSNILIALYDGRPVPKVIDFGVAKAVSQKLTEKTMFTGLGQIVGTLEYMSPEQAQPNQLDIDTRSDVYSLGVMLYELLTGDTPFDKQRLRSSAWDEMLRIIREEEPPKPSTKLSSSEILASVAANRKMEPGKLSALVRGELDWIVMQALEKDRARRYETASALAADVQHYLNDEAVVACPPSAAYRLKKFARRNKAALLVAGLILFFCMLLGSGIGWTFRDRVARQARVSEQIELILDEVARLEQEQKWPEALAAAKRASAVLVGGEAPEDLQERVRQVVSDLEMVERLEDIYLRAYEIKAGDFDYARGNRQYAAAFQTLGVEVDAMPADEVAERLRSHPAVLPALIVALDEWAWCRRVMKDKAGGETLTNGAQALDADPWRRRVRDALAAHNEKALEELAATEEIKSQASSTLALVARALTIWGKPERAKDVVDYALWEHPEDFWLHFEAAHAKRLSHPPRWDEAARHYTAALAVRPRSVAALNNLGAALMVQGKLDEAIACQGKAIELDPQNANAHDNLGTALYNQGKLDEAIACFRTSIELDPKDAAPHTNLGAALMVQGKLDEAIACQRKAIELDPVDANAHCNLGNALLAQGKPDEAIACYRKAVELDPKDAVTHTNLGNALKAQAKPDEAMACYRTAIELDPKYANAHGNLGNVLLDQGKPDEAISCYRTAIESDPKCVQAYCNLGVALKGQGKLDEAIACYRQAVELDPKDAVTHTNLGNALMSQAKSDEAIACYRKAIELDPNFASAHLHLGMALYEQGKLDEAIACYRKVIELDPKMAQAPNNLGSALLAQGKPDEAVACYRQAIELAPNPNAVAFHYNNLGLALNGQGKPDEAIACYRKAVELDPQGTAAYTNLCRVLLDQGKVDEAEAIGRTAVKIEVERIGQVPAAQTSVQLYNLACIYSRASAAVQADPQKAEEHAMQAVALLRKAQSAAGWDNVAHANKDHDLDAIRNREDFRQLIQELEEKDKQ